MGCCKIEPSAVTGVSAGCDKWSTLPCGERVLLRERKGNTMRVKGNKAIFCVDVVGLLLI